ncbi:MAG: hypothetical protein ACTSRP_24020, partial [Candidatus Helarchaeota archaeon]
LYLGTDPLNNDTDNDKLADGLEVIGWISNITHNNNEIEHRAVSSDPLVPDTDHDNLTDYQEYLFNTDPRSPDSDGDGLSDYEEWVVQHGRSYDSDGDGLSDYEENQTYIIKLANGTIIQTYSNSSSRDSDNDGLDDWEERYPGKDGFITDAFNNDTDGDGLIDSAEVYSTVKEYGVRKKIEKNIWNVFKFYAIIGQGVTNASVTITISVGEKTTEDGPNPADIQFKLYVNGKFVYSNSTTHKRYFCNITDITKIMEAKGIRYSGWWELRVNTTEISLLEEFKVEASLRLNPLDNDYDNDGLSDGEEMTIGEDGWYTNPASPDSDGDLLNDKYEGSIGTNPLSYDTDGDGANDKIDVAPLKNLIIRITAMEGHFGNAYWLPDPILCATFEVNDNKQKIITPHVRANKDPEPRKLSTYIWGIVGWKGIIPIWGWIEIILSTWSIKTTAEFLDSSTDSGYVEYYVDVPDDNNKVKINVELWNLWQILGLEMGGIGDRILNNYHYFNLTKNNELNSEEYTSIAGNNWVKFKIDTIPLTRVNTIAVYSNGSFENGHYPSIERMNLIILDVEGSNEVFDNGINVIMVPVPIFTNTKLHAIIEQAVNDTTKEIDLDKLPDCLKTANFSGIDRNSESINQYVESIITKEAVPVSEAMQILELCLISANETEGVIYNYTRVTAELSGVAPGVLELIPFDGSIMKNSDQGTMPKTLWQAFVQFWQNVIQLLYNVIVAIANFIANLINIIIQWGLNLLGMFEDAMDIIEAVVKAIIMVLVFILLAFELLMLTLGFILLLPFLLIIDAFPSTSTSWALFNFSLSMIINKNNKNYEFKIMLGFIIEWKYVPILDLNLPFTKFTLDTNIFEENVPKKSNEMSIESCILSIPGGNIKYPEDNTPPICNNTPEDISIWQNETAIIQWELYDESGGGTYRILKNETVIVNWTEWNNSKSIKYFINDTSSPGRTKYTIEFKDNAGNLNKDVVYVFVVKEGWPLSDHPNDIVA